MSFWSTITGWWNSESESLPGDQYPQDSSVAVLEPDKPCPPRAAAGPGPTAGPADSFEESPPGCCWWRPDGPPIVEAPRLTGMALDAPDQAMQAGILTSLESTLADPDVELPHLPHIPQQVLLLTRNESSKVRDIARLISQDQVLSADLLRRANSVAYGGATTVTALDAALVRLGMRGTRSLMISRSVKHVTLAVGGRGGQFRGEALWKQSLASGYVMAAFADCLKVNKEEAFLLGLLHDIGKVVVLRSCAQLTAATGRPVSDGLFSYVCQEYHELMGGMIADHWMLPPQVGAIVKSHHAELQSDDEFATTRAMIQLTDATISLLGYGPEFPYDLLAMPAASHLGLSGSERFIETLGVLPEAVSMAMSET
jgi:putative nucleotidyltransferase with HDIG domain